MIERVATLRQEIPELLGVRGTPMEKCDLRIGVATGEALVGSIGSDVMMSYTVMVTRWNLASRLEGANKAYGTRSLFSEKTIAAAGNTVDVREIDRVVVTGQTRSEIIFEILATQGRTHVTTAVVTGQVPGRTCGVSRTIHVAIGQRATIGPRPLRTESGSEIRHALTTQTSADAGSTTELGASAATGAENQAGNEKRARRGMKPTVESQIYEFQFWGTYITRKFGKLLPMVDTHRNS